MYEPSEALIQSMRERGYAHRGDVRFIRRSGKLFRLVPRTVFEGRVISWYLKPDWDLVVVTRSAAETPPENAPLAPAIVSAA